jgi:hypothetical protein
MGTARRYSKEVLERAVRIVFEHQSALFGIGNKAVANRRGCRRMYVTPTGIPGRGGKPIVLLGSPAAAKKVAGHWNEAGVANGEVYDSFFAETERQLATRFDVRKLPLWLVRGNLSQPSWETRYYVLT